MLRTKRPTSLTILKVFGDQQVKRVFVTRPYSSHEYLVCALAGKWLSVEIGDVSHCLHRRNRHRGTPLVRPYHAWLLGELALRPWYEREYITEIIKTK